MRRPAVISILVDDYRGAIIYYYYPRSRPLFERRCIAFAGDYLGPRHHYDEVPPLEARRDFLSPRLFAAQFFDAGLIARAMNARLSICGDFYDGDYYAIHYFIMLVKILFLARQSSGAILLLSRRLLAALLFLLGHGSDATARCTTGELLPRMIEVFSV